MVSYDLQSRRGIVGSRFLFISNLSIESVVINNKMMNKLSLTAVLGISSLLVGCSDDNTVFNEPEPIRAYESDAQIMAQFVEVDRASGTYVLNPDKKITASDYVLNRSREELMSVSQINRNRFLNEMEAVNSQLSAVKRSGLASAFVFSTLTSNVVMDDDDKDSFSISKLNEDSYSRSPVASLTLENGRSRRTSFFAQSDMVMTVNFGNGSTFYCAQVSLGDQDNRDAEIILISGIKSFIPSHSYRLMVPSIPDGSKTISGMTLIGDGNVTVSISR